MNRRRMAEYMRSDVGWRRRHRDSQLAWPRAFQSLAVRLRKDGGDLHLDTTNHYAQATLETKRKALEQADPSLRNAKPPRWKRDADLMAWLDSL